MSMSNCPLPVSRARYIAAVLAIAGMSACSAVEDLQLSEMVPLEQLNGVATQTDLLNLAAGLEKAADIKCDNCRFAAVSMQLKITSLPDSLAGPQFELRMTDGRTVRIDTTFSAEAEDHSINLNPADPKSIHAVLTLAINATQHPKHVRICFYKGAFILDVDGQIVDARELIPFFTAIEFIRVGKLFGSDQLKQLKLRHLDSDWSPEVEQRFAEVFQVMGKLQSMNHIQAMAQLKRVALLAKEHQELGLCLPSIHFETAMRHKRSGNREMAFRAFEACVASTKEALTIVHSNYIISKYEMAVHCSKSHSPAKARQFYEQAIASLDFGANENWMLPVACYGLSKLLGDREQFEEGIAHARRAKLVSDSCRASGAPSHAFCVKTRDQLANCFMALRDYSAAERELNEAAELVTQYSSLIDRATVAELRTSRATLAELQGRHAKANQLRREALDGLQNPNGSYPMNSWDLLYKQAVSEHAMGELGLARNLFLASLTNIKEFGGPNSLDQIIVLSKLVNLYDELHAELEMKNCVQQMSEIHAKADLERTSVHTSRLRYAEASMLMRDAEWEQAIRTLKEQASINAHRGESELNGYVLLRMAIAQRRSGNIVAANETAELAHELINARKGIADEITIVSVRELSILSLLQGANAHAIERLTEVSIIREALAKYVLSSCSTAMGRMWSRRSLAASEDIPGYLTLAGASSRQIYDSVWRSKKVLTRMRQLHVRLDNPVAEELRNCRVEMRGLVTANIKNGGAERLAAMAQRAAQLEAELADLSDVARIQLAERDSNVTTLLKQLGDHRAVVDLALIQLPNARPGSSITAKDVDSSSWRQFYVAFVLCPREDQQSAIHHVVLGDATQIDAAAKRFAQDFNAADGVFLRAALWSAIEPLLGDRKRIYLVPDGSLASIPWDALPAKDADRYLVEDGFSFTHVGYAQQIVEPSRVQPLDRFRAMTLVGDLEFGEFKRRDRDNAEPKAYLESVRQTRSFRSWPPLHASKHEIEEIAVLCQKFTPAAVNFLTRSNATDVEFAKAAEKCSILHVASHAFWAAPRDVDLLPVNPRYSVLKASSNESHDQRMTVALRNPLLLSGIALSAANSRSDGSTINDGIVLADEISRYDLRRMWLAVLSACDTGTGEPLAGEVVQGLTDAFHRAGTRNVVSSLWKVDDEKTAEFMIRMYDSIVRKKMPLDIAVASAKLHMLGTDSNSISTSRGSSGAKPSTPPPSLDAVKRRLPPKFWAGFQLHGPGS